jgi:2-hydroxy-3-oxopropionate reductase
MVKDLGTAAAAAHASGLTLPLTDLVLGQNQELVAQGHAQGDNANLMRLYDQVSSA